MRKILEYFRLVVLAVQNMFLFIMTLLPQLFYAKVLNAIQNLFSEILTFNNIFTLFNNIYNTQT